MCILWILKWVICDFLLGKKKAHSMVTALYVTLPVALVTYETSILYNQATYINKIQQDATVRRYLLTAKLLYMFRVSIAPIARSTQNCNCSFW